MTTRDGGRSERNLPPADVLPTAAVDLAHLRRYTLGDAALEREVLDLFLQQAPVTIDRLRQASIEPQWREAGHTLKGSARAVGAWRLAAVAERAERSAGWRERAAGRSVIEEIMVALADVQAFVEAFRRANAA